jgi:hypothetical protein
MAVQNLAMISLPNGMMIIGKKFGKDIKRPMLLVIEDQSKEGIIRFGMREIPFAGKGDISVGEGYSYWHYVTNKDVEDLYVQVTGTIIVPNMTLASGMGGTKQ